MQIYLLRHAIAEDGKPGGRDADRALVPEGKRKLREVLRHAKAAGVKPSLILTSPLKRALETAEIASSVLGYQAELLQTSALEPGSSPHAAWDEVRVHKDEKAVMLVGHEPLFSALTAHLLNTPTLAVDFKKGALVRIDVSGFAPQPRGVLKWMMTAKLA
ncbi:MAG: histidine phosphatase family protein [Bryobacteraceae bacterium]|nr:histidine phosphatase family protein [Bryobacteraceae bacterium]